MYKKNTNIQAKISRNLVKDALLVLMQKYRYKDVTVTQICQEAKISRQTYYRNFDAKDDILEYYLDNLLQEYLQDYCSHQDVYRQFKIFFDYMFLNKDFLSLISANHLFYLIDKTIEKNISRFIDFRQLASFDDANHTKYFSKFVASTVCSLLSLWIEDQFYYSSEIMAELAQRFLSGLRTQVYDIHR